MAHLFISLVVLQSMKFTSSSCLSNAVLTLVFLIAYMSLGSFESSAMSLKTKNCVSFVRQFVQLDKLKFDFIAYVRTYLKFDLIAYERSSLFIIHGNVRAQWQYVLAGSLQFMFKSFFFYINKLYRRVSCLFS